MQRIDGRPSAWKITNLSSCSKRGVIPRTVSSIASSSMMASMQATGRNAPCPCGSGKKYKQCCIPNSLGFHRSTVAREHFNRAVSLHGKGHFAEAIKLYEAALAADLTLAQAHANLGSAFSSLARFEDAIQSYSNAIALAPESAILWSNLGLAQQQIARYQEAENSLRTAIVSGR